MKKHTFHSQFIAAAVLAAMNPTPAVAAFSWSNCATTPEVTIQSLSVSPDPLTASGKVLPGHWETTYDPSTGQILNTVFKFLFFPAFAAENNVVGSANYFRAENPEEFDDCLVYQPLGIPCQLPIPAGTVSTGVGGVDYDGQNLSFAVLVNNPLTTADIERVEIHLDKKIFGVWVAIPALEVQNVNAIPWLTAGDYYMKTAVFGPASSVVSCLETYFTLADGGTAPFVFIPASDTTPPEITSCPQDQSGNATGPGGAVLSYPAATATDNSGVVTLSYSKESGSLFSMGDTLVTVTATDGSLNEETCTFTVHIKDAREQLDELISIVRGLAIHLGTKIALTSKLEEALASEGIKRCSHLKSFISLATAQRGKKLSLSQSDDLIVFADRIKSILVCP